MHMCYTGGGVVCTREKNFQCVINISCVLLVSYVMLPDVLKSKFPNINKNGWLHTYKVQLKG